MPLNCGTLNSSYSFRSSNAFFAIIVDKVCHHLYFYLSKKLKDLLQAVSDPLFSCVDRKITD